MKSIFLLVICTACAVAFVTEETPLQPPRRDVPLSQYKPILVPRTVTEVAAGNGEENSGKIVGGQNADPNEYPHQVALLIEFQLDLFGFCAGTVIGPEWIVTAAQCVDGGIGVLVVAGAHRLDMIEPNQQYRDGEAYYTQGFDLNTLSNDVALIKLSYGLILNGYVQPLSLPKKTPSTGSSAVTVGWGSTTNSNSDFTDILKEATVTIIAHSECQTAFGASLPMGEDMVVCTRGPSICVGDGGGPLINQGRLVGVTSFFGGNCNSGLPSGFAKVDKHVGWIEDVSGIKAGAAGKTAGVTSVFITVVVCMFTYNN